MKHNNNSKSRSLEVSKSSDSEWTTVIKPRNKLLEVNLKEIWDYRDLLTLFVKRDMCHSHCSTSAAYVCGSISPTV